MAHPQAAHAPAQKPDIREKGAPTEAGGPQTAETRLFMQLQVLSGCSDPAALKTALEASGLDAVLYLDVSDPHGVGVLFFSEDPSLFVEQVRDLFNRDPFSTLTLKPEFTMTGRTYSTGREADLEDWLLKKPRRTVLNRDWPWAIWYPLRRKKEFALLTPQDQGKMLYEHGIIGRAFGEADYAHDVRLSCHGLDRKDNEFVIGLVGAELFPLSRIVQEMRKTQQTGRYMQSMGPFFIGKAYWQSV